MFISVYCCVCWAVVLGMFFGMQTFDYSTYIHGTHVTPPCRPTPTPNAKVHGPSLMAMDYLMIKGWKMREVASDG